jgi:CRP-like cAMP-binding protein
MSQKISITELKFFHPLDNLSAENIREIASKLKARAFEKGATIFRKGDSEDDHLYLYQGSVELRENGKTVKEIKSGSAEAQAALAHIIPRNYEAVAKTDCTVLVVDSDLLDMMLTWNQSSSVEVEDLSADDEDWMSRLLSSEAFRRIPPANIQAIFTSLEDIEVKPGDAIIKQDDPGDYFYIIKQGRCMVTRKMPGSDKDIKLADLGAGQSFGEEALISDANRNATVVMLTRGVLSRLSKEQFLELLNEPMMEKLDYATAKARVDAGEAAWLDVRLPAEYTSAHLKGCQHVPLIFLRMKLKELDPATHYILYCDTGRRSSSASYILNENGYHTAVLTNGTKDVPTTDMEGKDIG